MHILQIEHKVPSFEGWKKAFDSDPVGRQKSGVKRYVILRPTDDPNYVIVHLYFEKTEDAVKMLSALRKLWGEVEGIVMSGPQGRILEEVEAIEL